MDVPQFMSLTFDDNVNEVIFPVIQNLTSGLAFNPNGCPLSATFYVSTLYTDYQMIQGLFNRGHEIAVHTMNHVSQPSQGEILGAYRALNAFAGIPKSKLKGFRTPFLAFSYQTYQHLSDSNLFLYDSSMSVNYKSAPIWPYTLDHGPATECTTGSCPANFSMKGLWSVPMYTLDNTDGTLNAAMDPNAKRGNSDLKENLLSTLKFNFLARYNSTRVPMGLYLHAAASLTVKDRTDAYVEFINWTLSFPDVYWVNNQQLISWIQNPTNIKDSLTNPALDCIMPPVSENNVEICDGVDNNNDGKIDEGLASACYYPSVQLSLNVNFEIILNFRHALAVRHCIPTFPIQFHSHLTMRRNSFRTKDVQIAVFGILQKELVLL
jgi:peptidoglycan/xylan/chitin deacetylase (PgdA/CDA1 family)